MVKSHNGNTNYYSVWVSMANKMKNKFKTISET